MKKILLFFMAIIATVFSAQAETVTFDVNSPLTWGVESPESGKGTYLTSQDNPTKSITIGSVTFTTNKGTANTNSVIWNTNDVLTFRSYKNSTFEITSTGKITKIEFDGVKDKFLFTANPEGLTINDAKATWTGNANSVVFSVTGTSQIKTITVTTTNEEGDVPAESVTLTDNLGNALGMYTALTVTDKLQLKAVVAPANATNKKVTWEVMQDDDVISLENGLVTALKPGRAAVKVTTEDGEFQAATTFVVSEIQDGTIADFLAAKGRTCYLTGIVSNIENTTYGNFTLTDETGSIYVYGCLNAAGESKKFAELGVEEGNKIKVLAREYKLYGETDEAVNVVFVENFGTPAAPEEITFKVELKGYDFTVTPSNENVSYYIDVQYNETFENISESGFETIEDYADFLLEEMGEGLEYFQGTSTQSLIDDWYLDEEDIAISSIMVFAVDENYKRISEIQVTRFDTLTAINSIKAEKAATYYNLAGKRINNAQKGIVICNNRKMMVK